MRWIALASSQGALRWGALSWGLLLLIGTAGGHPGDSTEPPPEKKPDLLAIAFDAGHQFGLTVKATAKRLTFSTDGGTNNTRIKVNGVDIDMRSLNITPGVEGPRGRPELVADAKYTTYRSKWTFTKLQLTFTQTVAIHPNESTGEMDTAVVTYTFTNDSKAKIKVGLRTMIDTLIGNNDGAPFIIPNRPGLCDTFAVFSKAADIPAYLEVLENSDITNPGTVVKMGLVNSSKYGFFEQPSSVILSGWPGTGAAWSYQITPIGVDSAVGLYWEEKLLDPGKSREMGFTYGLTQIKTVADRLALSADVAVAVNQRFSITAFLGRKAQGATVTIEVPAGVRLLPGTPAQQRVVIPPNRSFTQVSWTLVGSEPGAKTFRVRLSDGTQQTHEITLFR